MSHRRLAILIVCALAGAGCCAGAAAIVWWHRDYRDSLTGALQVTLKGSQLLGELVPIALVALAGLGAMFAARGVLRRIVGVLVTLGGVLVAVRSVLAAGHQPLTELAGELKRPATADGLPVLTVAGPAVAIAGALLIIVAGVLVATGADRARRMGAAYDAPARRRESARNAVTGSGELDPGAMWRAIDAGADPTDPAGAHESSSPEAGNSPAPAGEDPSPDTGPDGDPAAPDLQPATPGHSSPSGPDTMGPRDGPENTARDRLDTAPADRPHRSAPSSQASDEETTG